MSVLVFLWWTSKAKEGNWLKLTALTSKSWIYNICDLFDGRQQQQTMAAEAAGAISQVSPLE